MQFAHGSNSEIQSEVCAYLSQALTVIFPTSGIMVHTRTIIGQCDIHLRYTNARKAEDCANGIWENDPAFMRFMIQSDNAGFFIEAPTCHSMKARKAAKYRIIKGATEMDCAVKLVAWFKKNSTEFLKLGLR